MRLVTEMRETHVPVLGPELVKALDLRPGDIAVDCTFGAGGHARLVAKEIGAKGKLIAIDRDPDAGKYFKVFSAEASCESRLIESDFLTGVGQLIAEGVRAKGIYLDLGLSSMQIAKRERGFSYSCDAPLDMRMNPSQSLSAAEIINSWPERQLASIFKLYGEERYAKSIAKAVARRRTEKPFETTADLVEVVKGAVPAPARFAAGHPAKRVFQAVRIAVNNELELLEKALPEAWRLLAPDGVLAVISFHSLEDRTVKKFMQELARDCICPPGLPICKCDKSPEAELISRRAVVPGQDEVERNPRARSAKFRAARKLPEGGDS